MGPHMLVIEDAPEVLGVYDDVLRAEGYTVTVADHVPTDLAAIERLQPDVILLDYLVDGQPQGGQLIRALKQRSATQHVPILVCTGASRTVQAELPYFHRERIGVLLKPFDLDALLNGLRELLGEPRRDGQTVIVDPPEPRTRALG